MGEIASKKNGGGAPPEAGVLREVPRSSPPSFGVRSSAYGSFSAERVLGAPLEDPFVFGQDARKIYGALLVHEAEDLPHAFFGHALKKLDRGRIFKSAD